MVEEIKFEVGQKYENMKGVFEVIAIRKDSMDIRWEDGEEIDTPIALQRRIIERMQFEKEMEEAQKAQKAKKAKTSSKGGKQFTGLEASDFTNSVSKTTWRGRGQIGGAVATRVKSNQLKFNSWAVLRKPEVNWLDTDRQKQGNLKLQAVFYARVEEPALFYGLQIPFADSDNDGKSDWVIFLDWLKKEENSSWVAKQCKSYDLYFADVKQKGVEGRLKNRDGQWIRILGDQEESVESLHDFMEATSQAGGKKFRIEKRVEKEAAVDKKQDIAKDIASLFDSLMPLYVAIVTKTG
jgi:hypothetical protein